MCVWFLCILICVLFTFKIAVKPVFYFKIHLKVITLKVMIKDITLHGYFLYCIDIGIYIYIYRYIDTYHNFITSKSQQLLVGFQQIWSYWKATDLPGVIGYSKFGLKAILAVRRPF